MWCVGTADRGFVPSAATSDLLELLVDRVREVARCSSTDERAWTLVRTGAALRRAGALEQAINVLEDAVALGPAWELIPIALLGTWALVVNGTFFAAISIRTRAREIMLPLLLFPLSIPALLAMVNATTSILTGEESARFWIALLVAYDVVFTTACLLLFETVLEAE